MPIIIDIYGDRNLVAINLIELPASDGDSVSVKDGSWKHDEQLARGHC